MVEEKSAVIGFLEKRRGERNIRGDRKNLVVCFLKLDSCHYASHNGGDARLQDFKISNVCRIPIS